MLERLGMSVDLAEFRATHAGKGLAGRTSDKHVDCRADGAKIQIGSKRLGRQLCDVAGLAVPVSPLWELRPCDAAASGSNSTAAASWKPAL